jgi:hypothetical protein
MCVHTEINQKVVGRIPGCLLIGDVAAEWDARLIRWALQPMTRIAAAEHILRNNGDKILIYKRTNPNVALFSIEMVGDAMGVVVSF